MTVSPYAPPSLVLYHQILEHHLSREMAAADMARRDLSQRRRFDLAARLGMAAARVEVAA